MIDEQTTDASLPFDVVVIRSKRRKRSVGARLAGNTITVTVPTWMSKAEEDSAIDEMVRRFTRKAATLAVDLTARAHALASDHMLPLPDHIEWADNLTAVWGLCTPSTRHIRISSRLVGFPMWVLDYVIVHELAHLLVDEHSSHFWDVVHRYPKAERAIGYLIAKSGEDDASC
jgi:predicted metal-dependent hydrolase